MCSAGTVRCTYGRNELGVLRLEGEVTVESLHPLLHVILKIFGQIDEAERVEETQDDVKDLEEARQHLRVALVLLNQLIH